MPFQRTLLAAVSTILFLSCIQTTLCDAQSNAALSRPWWQDQINVMSWATLHQPEDQPYLSFARELDSKVADRGIFFGHFEKDHANVSLPKPEQVTAFYKQHGLRVTAFFSVEQWDPSPDAVSRLIALLKTYVDAGCDGVHLDLLFQPAAGPNAAASVRRMREELHRYGQAKYRRDILFTGNVWRLDSPFALQAAALTDVVWIESWGNSDLELVRMARVGRSLGNPSTPVWYHLQPDTDTQARIQRLENLPKTLFASCLFEDAQFLCNYKYPVPVKVASAKPGQEAIDWKMFTINPGWRKSLVQYATFARTYRQYLSGALPQSDVLVAFRPEEVKQADGIMDQLLARGIDFNVLVYGADPFRPAAAESLRGYKVIITPTPHSKPVHFSQ